MKKAFSLFDFIFRQRPRFLSILFQCVYILLFVTSCREQPSDSARTAGTKPDTFSVAFYNVENLFDNEFDGNEYPEYRPDPKNWNRKVSDIKYDNIASVIAAIDADIIALCEVEDPDALRQLAVLLKKKGCLYKYQCIIDSAAGSNTHPAILSRFPIKDAVLHPVQLPENVRTRGILDADMIINNKPLKLFVNHWPSKHHSESFRVAAADTLCAHLAALPKQTDYLILGDFNSDLFEFSTFTTSGHNDTRGITGINHRLGTLQNVTDVTSRLRNVDEVIHAPFPAHYDLWMELSEAVRMSYIFRGNRQTPDHILLPAALFDSTGFSYVDNSFNSFTWGSRLLKNGKPTGWKLNYHGKQKFHAGEGYSDHLPIIAKFTTAPFSEDVSKIDFNDAFTTESSNPDSWFEFHTNGWISCDNRVSYVRDTVTSVSGGKLALRVAAPTVPKNYTALKAVIPPAYRVKGNVFLYLRGTGAICLRTRKGDKWLYHNIVSGKKSGRATYPPFRWNIWKTIEISPEIPADKDVEIELRCAKNTALDLWIDR